MQGKNKIQNTQTHTHKHVHMYGIEKRLNANLFIKVKLTEFSPSKHYFVSQGRML